MARGSPRRGSDGRCRSADAELWRSCWLDVAKGEQGRSREPRPPTRSDQLIAGRAKP
jgi:hypothetical protein